MSKNHKVFYRTNYDVIKNEHVVEFALDLRVYAKSKEELTEERINELFKVAVEHFAVNTETLELKNYYSNEEA